VRQTRPRDPQPGLLKVLLHDRLALDPVHVLWPQAKNVEILAQPGLGLEPVLVHGLEPLELAVPMGKVAQCPQQLVVVVHIGNFVILREGLPQFGAQRIVFDIG